MVLGLRFIINNSHYSIVLYIILLYFVFSVSNEQQSLTAAQTGFTCQYMVRVEALLCLNAVLWYLDSIQGSLYYWKAKANYFSNGNDALPAYHKIVAISVLRTLPPWRGASFSLLSV